jgi:hypothetical protein
MSHIYTDTNDKFGLKDAVSLTKIPFPTDDF